MTLSHRVARHLMMLWCVMSASVATAHEFWIDADRFQVAVGDRITARLVNGEDFKGVTLSFIDRRIARFDMIHQGQGRPVAGRMGDNPALNMAAPGAGLVAVVHETTPSSLTYKTWDKFQKFADHKDFGDWRATHAANGYPDPPFKERYTRHAKALFAVGNGEGQDKPAGLKTEFVALTNPYAAGFDGNMRVQVLLDGAPRPNVQVEVFERDASEGVTVSLYRTDGSGIASVPVTRGHDYLFDAVTLAPVTGDADVHWDTFWAALTFRVP